MKSRVRSVAGMVALGSIVLLGGCVAYPAGGSYDPGYGYGGGYSSGYGYGGDPYYTNPVVVAPSVYVQGGRSYDRGYYDRRPNYRPGYDGRSGYDGRPPRAPNVARPGRQDEPQRPPSVRPRPERPSSSYLPPRSPNAPPVVQPNGQYVN